jgi:hypothetical protein
MALFECWKCGCAEDTALCRYWTMRLQDIAPMCSGCDPIIGKWHGEFPQVPYQVGIKHKVKREVERWLGVSIDVSV